MRWTPLLCAALLLTGCDTPAKPASDTEHYTMATDAMEPALHSGQRFTARRVEAGKYQPKRGDVVVFRAPESWGRGADRPSVAMV